MWVYTGADVDEDEDQDVDQDEDQDEGDQRSLPTLAETRVAPRSPLPLMFGLCAFTNCS